MVEGAAPAAGFVARIVRYGVVGTAISLVYTLAVVLLVDGLHVPSPTVASVLAFAVMLPVAYLAHRDVTFRAAARDPAQAWRFAITTTTSFMVATAGMYVLTAVLGRSYLLGIALNWVLIPTANFAVYLIWVFRTGEVAAFQGTPVAAIRRPKPGLAQLDQ